MFGLVRLVVGSVFFLLGLVVAVGASLDVFGFVISRLNVGLGVRLGVDEVVLEQLEALV